MRGPIDVPRNNELLAPGRSHPGAYSLHMGGSRQISTHNRSYTGSCGVDGGLFRHLAHLLANPVGAPSNLLPGV